MMSRSAAWMTRPPGRRTQAIINTNLKTELCRNWQNGACTYGERCAFAHGKNELKYRTLREMQNAGRIPDAAKYRCFPCMTWVATGSCPYSNRCVFIHDPRVQGSVEASLYAGTHPSSAYHSSDSSFFFPDLPRDPDSLDLPRGPSLYDLDPSMATAEDRSDRAVYHLWYSFVSTFSEAGGDNDTSAMAATIPFPGVIKPELTRDISQSTDGLSFYTDSDSSGAPSVGSSPSPPPAADNIAFPTANDGYAADPSLITSLDEEQLLVADPPRFDKCLNRLPVFLKLGKGDRAPPLNCRSRSTSTQGSSLGRARPLTLRDCTDSRWDMTQRTGLSPPPDYIYEPNLCTDVGISPYRQRSISPPTNAEGASLYYNVPEPQHGFPATAAVMKTPSPDYHLVSEPPAIPALQPIEIVRQPAGAVTAQDGMSEDGLSTAMRMEVTPPGYVVRHHQHLPAFPGYSRVGSLVDASLTQTRTMYSVASF